MESSSEELLKRIERSYENIYNLLDGFRKAASSEYSTDITVSLKKADGTSEDVSINSFQRLQQELTRIDNNFKSLTNANNISYILNGDGSMSQQTKTSFMNAEYIENFGISGAVCVVDKKSAIFDLIYPMVKLPISIDSTIRTDILCRTFEILSGWENIPALPTMLDLEYLQSQGIISYNDFVRSLPLEKEQIKYFGKFTIETLSALATPNTYSVTLNTIKYQGLESIGKSIDLKIGDILVSKSGNSKYQVTDLEKVSKFIFLTRIAGSEVLSSGIDALLFNAIASGAANIVNIPIKPEQKIVLFLSTENLNKISYPSTGLKLDTTNYQVNYNGETFSIDDFFSTYVTDFSTYLEALIDETNIPFNLGIVPAIPTLIASNFKVIQINKHLTDSATTTELAQLNKQKQTIQNNIDYNLTQIKTIQSNLDSQAYTTVEDKNYYQNKIVTFRQENNTLNTNLLAIAQQIDTDAIKYGLKSTDAKYRCIGFWPLQSAIYSTQTKLQHIIKYDVQYRYLSKESTTLENTSYTMLDGNGNEITVAFSAWNDMPSKTLTKVKADDETLVWENPIMDSVNDININQCSIAINENESIEIRVRACSEAGYPISPLKSEWSEILRIEFPTDIKNNAISSTISQNSLDLAKAEFSNILQQAGLTGHISGTITEAEKTFYHQAKDIATGQYTIEQKNIALDVLLNTMLTRLSTLENSDNIKTATIQIIDFNSEIYSVSNNSSIELFAGNYSDTVGILDGTAWGGIIRKKGYIKIKNTNVIPIELKTLVPGETFDPQVASKYYNTPVINTEKFIQDSKQILYFRNVDLTGSLADAYKLVAPKLPPVKTYPDSIDIVQSSPDDKKNIVYLDTNDVVRIGKVNAGYSREFAAFTIEHPDYDYNNLQALKEEFNRVKLYTANLKASQYQDEFSGYDVQGLGFNDKDCYAVGKNTCGAFLYPVIVNKTSIAVSGYTALATLIIPANSEILIPFVFEFRMIDRLGNVNGVSNYDTTTTLEYNKKMGIDLLINNETFKFDVSVVCRLKSKISAIDSTNVNSVVASFNNESQGALS